MPFEAKTVIDERFSMSSIMMITIDLHQWFLEIGYHQVYSMTN